MTLAALPWTGAPAPWGWAGIFLVLTGASCMCDARSRGPAARRGTSLGVLVAAATAAYTLWDAYSVEVLQVAVVPYMALSSAAQAILLTCALWPRRAEMPSCLRRHAHQAPLIAALVPLSYGVVVLALRWGSAGMVATSRSLNVVVGSLFAAILLGEHLPRTRVLGIALICAGAGAVAV